MKQIMKFTITVLSSFTLITGCASTKKVEDIIVEETPTIEKEMKVEQEPIVEPTDNDEEYTRSIGDMEGVVSKEVFTEDKKDILEIISELDNIMKNDDYESWTKYIDKESLTYWQNPKNLHKAESRLPVKGLSINDLEDYFRLVFIQSRVGRQIDEIRYISDTSVKAVQVREEQDVVYYYFHKINNIWKLNLPPLED